MAPCDWILFFNVLFSVTTVELVVLCALAHAFAPVVPGLCYVRFFSSSDPGSACRRTRRGISNTLLGRMTRVRVIARLGLFPKATDVVLALEALEGHTAMLRFLRGGYLDTSLRHQLKGGPRGYGRHHLGSGVAGAAALIKGTTHENGAALEPAQALMEARRSIRARGADCVPPSLVPILQGLGVPCSSEGIYGHVHGAAKACEMHLLLDVALPYCEGRCTMLSTKRPKFDRVVAATVGRAVWELANPVLTTRDCARYGAGGFDALALEDRGTVLWHDVDHFLEPTTVARLMHDHPTLRRVVATGVHPHEVTTKLGSVWPELYTLAYEAGGVYYCPQGQRSAAYVVSSREGVYTPFLKDFAFPNRVVRVARTIVEAKAAHYCAVYERVAPDAQLWQEAFLADGRGRVMLTDVLWQALPQYEARGRLLIDPQLLYDVITYLPVLKDTQDPKAIQAKINSLNKRKDLAWMNGRDWEELRIVAMAVSVRDAALPDSSLFSANVLGAAFWQLAQQVGDVLWREKAHIVEHIVGVALTTAFPALHWPSIVLRGVAASRAVGRARYATLGVLAAELLFGRLPGLLAALAAAGLSVHAYLRQWRLQRYRRYAELLSNVYRPRYEAEQGTVHVRPGPAFQENEAVLRETSLWGTAALLPPCGCRPGKGGCSRCECPPALKAYRPTPSETRSIMKRQVSGDVELVDLLQSEDESSVSAPAEGTVSSQPDAEIVAWVAQVAETVNDDPVTVLDRGPHEPIVANTTAGGHAGELGQVDIGSGCLPGPSFCVDVTGEACADTTRAPAPEAPEDREATVCNVEGAVVQLGVDVPLRAMRAHGLGASVAYVGHLIPKGKGRLINDYELLSGEVGANRDMPESGNCVYRAIALCAGAEPEEVWRAFEEVVSSQQLDAWAQRGGDHVSLAVAGVLYKCRFVVFKRDEAGQLILLGRYGLTGRHVEHELEWGDGHVLVLRRGGDVPEAPAVEVNVKASSRGLGAAGEAFVRTLLHERTPNGAVFQCSDAEYTAEYARCRNLGSEQMTGVTGTLGRLQQQGRLQAPAQGSVAEALHDGAEARNRTTVRVLSAAGFAGCGKSDPVLQAMAVHAGAAARAWCYVSPRSALTQDARESFDKRRKQLGGHAAATKVPGKAFNTQEMAYGRDAEVTIFDELSLYAPGYFDLYVLTHSCSVYVVLGDPTQNVYYNPAPESQLNTMTPEALHVFGKLGTPWYAWSHRVPQCVARFLGVASSNPVEGQIKLVNRIDARYPLIVATDIERTNYGQNHVAVTYTSGTIQGQTMPCVQIVATRNMLSMMSMASLAAIVTRVTHSVHIVVGAGARVEDVRSHTFFGTLLAGGRLDYLPLVGTRLLRGMQELVPTAAFEEVVLKRREEVPLDGAFSDREVFVQFRVCHNVVEGPVAPEEHMPEVVDNEPDWGKFHLPVVHEPALLPRVYQDVPDRAGREFVGQFGQSYMYDDERYGAGLAAMGFPYQSRSDATFSEATIRARLTPSTYDANEADYVERGGLADVLWETAARALALPFEAPPFDWDFFESCNAEQYAKRLEKPLGMMRALEDRATPDKPYNHVQHWIKSQGKLKLEAHGLALPKAGQTISSTSEVVVGLFGGMFRYVSAMTRRESANQRVIVYKGYSPAQFDALIAERWSDGMEDTKTVNDFSAFDSTQGGESVGLEVRWLRYFGVPEELVESYRWWKTHIRSDKIGVKTTSRDSGEPGTYDGNTLYSLAITFLKYGPAAAHRGCWVFGGDDMATNHEVHACETWARHARHVRTVSKTAWPAEADFCGWLLTPAGILRSPLLMYMKWRTKTARGHHEHDFLASFAAELTFTYRKAARCVDYLGPIDVACLSVVVRRVHEVSGTLSALLFSGGPALPALRRKLSAWLTGSGKWPRKRAEIAAARRAIARLESVFNDGVVVRGADLRPADEIVLTTHRTFMPSSDFPLTSQTETVVNLDNGELYELLATGGRRPVRADGRQCVCELRGGEHNRTALRACNRAWSHLQRDLAAVNLHDDGEREVVAGRGSVSVRHVDSPTSGHDGAGTHARGVADSLVGRTPRAGDSVRGDNARSDGARGGGVDEQHGSGRGRGQRRGNRRTRRGGANVQRATAPTSGTATSAADAGTSGRSEPAAVAGARGGGDQQPETSGDGSIPDGIRVGTQPDGRPEHVCLLDGHDHSRFSACSCGSQCGVLDESAGTAVQVVGLARGARVPIGTPHPMAPVRGHSQVAQVAELTRLLRVISARHAAVTRHSQREYRWGPAGDPQNEWRAFSTLLAEYNAIYFHPMERRAERPADAAYRDHEGL